MRTILVCAALAVLSLGADEKQLPKVPAKVDAGEAAVKSARLRAVQARIDADRAYAEYEAVQELARLGMATREELVEAVEQAVSAANGRSSAEEALAIAEITLKLRRGKPPLETAPAPRPKK